jgi:hypothetical protein
MFIGVIHSADEPALLFGHLPSLAWHRLIAVPFRGKRYTRTIDHYCRDNIASSMLRYPTLLHSTPPHSHSMISGHDNVLI